MPALPLTLGRSLSLQDGPVPRLARVVPKAGTGLAGDLVLVLGPDLWASAPGRSQWGST